MLSSEHLESLLDAAIAAPSADNRHPVRWQRAGSGFKWIATGEQRPLLDHEQVLAYISLGAMAVNIEMRASALGLHARSDCGFQPLRHGESVVSWTFEAAAAVVDELHAEIPRRHTNRRMVFRRPKLDTQELIARMDTDAQSQEAQVTWLDQTDARRRAVKLIGDAEALRFSSRELHAELFQAIRWDAGWNTTTAVGIPPGALGLSPLEQLSFRSMRSWAVQRLANLAFTHRVSAWRGAALPCRIAPHLCAISGMAHQPLERAWQAGRAMQRVWLRCSRAGLAAQVLAASPLYAAAAVPSVTPITRELLARGWAALCGGHAPSVVIRWGRAEAPLVRASRPEPAQLAWVA